MSTDLDARVDFMIIGAQKSGSTFLQHYLSAHVGVWMPPGEQPHLQDPYYSPAAVAALTRDLESAPAGAKVGIKRPAYLARPEVPGRVRRLAPRVRLLATLRNPIDRAVSAFYHYRHYGLAPDTDLNGGLRMLVRGDVPGRFGRAMEILEFGRYGEHLSRWAGEFDRDHLLVVCSDRLRYNPRDELNRLERFLGLSSFEPPPTGTANPGPYSPVRRTYMKVVRRLSGLDNTQGATGLAEHPLGRRAMAFDDGWLAERFRGRPDRLDDDVHDALAEYYADDEARLTEFLGAC